MDIWTALSRAKRGFRDDLRLHVVAIASLVVAFLCLGTALLSVENLTRIADRWSQSQHMTIYLRDGAAEADVVQLRMTLENLREVAKVEQITSARARELFAEQTNMGSDVASLPADAFPGSLEIDLTDHVSSARIDKIAERVQRFAAVEEVETYRSFFGQLRSLLDAGRSGAVLLAMLVVVCVLAVIGNTIRLAVANRRREIEVLKLCGATDSFVRSPFVIEGVIQAVTASTLAMVLLCLAYLALHTHVDATLTQLAGVKLTFLPPLTLLGTVLAAGFVGALGSALSLRRYLQI
ncbi:MAG TPA: permease-like cell division protein FtsX [Polyangiales bacterium]|jgi:cell division transport system permease protein|nr:permease-like cell division protein FtsX [Polyangiales bacterium]